MNIKCKACGNGVRKVDLRSLCTHCAFKIDTADAIASDINGIREDMRNVGIPTSGFSRNSSIGSNWIEDGFHLVDENEEDENE